MKEKMTKLDIQAVLALADNNMNVAKTGKELFFHRNTIVYHLDKVKRNTGLDPLNFYDLMKLVLCLKEGENNEP